MRPLVALTTDFGPSSPYVAEMKGVILSALPDVRLVDVSHTIPPQSIRHAEVVLRSTAFCMPTGAVHVVVVDPGVGTDRRPIAVRSRGMVFVGPDNGVLGLPLRQVGARAVVLDRVELFREPVQATFHGRDIFAPVAAELAGGIALEEAGSPLEDAVPSTLPAPRIEDGRIVGEALVADHFGNLLTNIPVAEVGAGWHFEADGRALRWVRTYGEASAGELLALPGSDGFVEIAVRESAVPLDVGASVACVREGTSGA